LLKRLRAVLLPGCRKIGDEPLTEPAPSANGSASGIAGLSGLPQAAVDALNFDCVFHSVFLL
jgi:hypothetical protein